MRFERTDGCFFELRILGYQIPEIEVQQYDSNWLMISIDVRHPLGSWRATDPCLLTYEAAWLADWLEQLGAGSRSKGHQYFTEPNLEFHLTPGSKKGEFLRVCFSHEFTPPWASADFREDEEHHLDFPLLGLNLAEAARLLKEQLRAYPQRAAC